MPICTVDALDGQKGHNLVSRGWSVGFDLAGGRDLTGFGLLLWRKGDPHPNYANALVKGAADSLTYTGLRPGTYQFRIQACNGKNSCYPWTKTEGHNVTIPGDQVQDLSATAGVGQLEVRWRAPADTGGKTITRYLVQYRIQGVTAWTT